VTARLNYCSDGWPYPESETHLDPAVGVGASVASFLIAAPFTPNPYRGSVGAPRQRVPTISFPPRSLPPVVMLSPSKHLCRFPAVVTGKVDWTNNYPKMWAA